VGESGFRAVWGTSIDSLIATGTEVPLAAGVDGRWSAVTLPVASTSLDAIWANSPNDIYVAGEVGAAFHFDGTSWTSIAAASTAAFFDLCATPAGEVFACVDDNGPAVFKRSNSAWELFANGLPESQAIWATNAQSIYLAGVDGYVGRFDGDEFLPVSRTGGFCWHDIWGTPSDEVFFVGDDGHLGRYFFGFQEMGSPVTTALRSISGVSATHIFAVGDEGTILHFDGTAWTQEPVITSRDLVAVHMFEDGRAVALGELGTVLSFDAQAWSVVIEGEPLTLVDASGVDAGHVFFTGHNEMGDGVVRHLDGRTWTFPGEEMSGIWAATPVEAIVVGASGATHRFDGAQWVKMINGALSNLNAVHGIAGVRAYAVGDNGNLRYSNPPFTSWSAMVPPIEAIYDVRDVWAAAIDNVFAVGPSGRVLRYRGGNSLKWSAEETGLAGGAFTAIAGRDADDVSAVTDDGRIYHYDGTRWRALPVTEAAPWVDVAAGARGTFLAVSSLPSTVLLTGFDVGNAANPVYLGRFHAAWIEPGTAYVAGSEGTLFRYNW
jgi:hypothetical protein